MIYLLEDRDYLKIGFTRNLKDRLGAYELHNCYAKLLETKEGTLEDERNLHSLCRAYHYKGEWFNNCKEVKEILQYYKVPEAFEQTKKWYDGYRFGNTDIYCPWDVINHCRALKVEPDATPQPYWINTSGNYIVKRFIEKANQQTRREIEQLIEGKAIQKEIRLELTYNELDSTIENLWSVLFATGYLSQQGKPQGRTYSLIIPNESIRQIFIEQIQEWSLKGDI